MAALATVIDNLVIFNLKTINDCQVCTVFQASLAEILILTCHNPKLVEIVAFVSVSAC